MKIHEFLRARPRIGLVLTLAVAQSGLAMAAWGESRSSPNQDARKTPVADAKRTLDHEETLRWINEHRAWQRARKTRSIWARPVEVEEVGKEFQTADHVKEVARTGFWLCVGVAGEPWFQSLEKIETKYERDGEEPKTFDFDVKSRLYRKYKPKQTVRNWAARVAGADVEGFFIRPNYDLQHPLYSPAGGYVVKDDVDDPYRDNPKDVWLVQEGLFKSTYEIVNAATSKEVPCQQGSAPR
jgi:hypothetical protein